MKQQKRATFEDVCIAQDKLLDFLDTCIQKSLLLDVRKRQFFIENFRLATLGIGSERHFFIQGEQQRYDIGHVGHAAYWLAYRDNDPVKVGNDMIPIRRFWLQLRDECFYLFPKAQEISIKMSKEIVDYFQGNTSSYDYKDL